MPPLASGSLSVVTVTRDRPDLLLRKAQALARQTLATDAFAWRIWSNDPPAATDATRQRLQGAGLPFAWSLDGGEELPVGLARNRAAERACGAVLLLSDDDCLPDPDALASHLAFHADHPNAAGIGPLRLPDELRRGRRAEPFERPLRLGGGRASWINLTGANSSVPSDAFRAVGGYDPAWRGYGGEDPELALRLRAHGLRFRHVPDAGAIHVGRVWDDADKAYRAGWAHRRVADR
ncbi:MAG: glycosyltransferase family 2 protein, partial [Trueperaceae bacterium]